MAWKVKWLRSEKGGIWRLRCCGGLQEGGGTMLVANKWPRKRITPTLSKGFHVTRSLCNEDNQGRKQRFQVAKRRPYGYPETGQLRFLPAQNPVPCPPGMPPCLHSQSIEFIGADITSRLCGRAQPIGPLHPHGQGICPGKCTWAQLSQWEPSWGFFLEILGERHFSLWGCKARSM